MQALNHIVIIQEVENKNETSFGFDKSGIVDKNEKYKKGQIISLGVDCPVDEIHTIKEGDFVLYDSYKTSPLSIGGVEYKTLYYNDLVCSV